MLKSAKSSVGWMARKAVALLVAWSFFATSVWAAALPGQAVPSRNPGFVSWWAVRQLWGDKALKSALSKSYKSESSNPASLASSIFSNYASLKAAAAAPMAMMQGGGGVSSSISFNFNATAIPAGDMIWFSAVLKLNGTVPKSPVSIAVHNSTIQFTAGSTNYTLNVPNSVVTFSPTVTTSSANFDTANNPQPVWLQNQLNPQPSGNTLLQAFAFPVPAGGLPGGIKNVTWTNTFTSDTANITLNWQWAAAVYTGCVNTAYNSDDVKPTDDTSASIYKNSDHAGTPEACKTSVTQGATGGGGSNYTGSLSGTASVTPPVAAASPVITGTISPAANGNGWNKSNVTVSFSCSDANFAIATCPAPVTVSTEGAGQVITGTAVDQTGTTGRTSVTVNLDKTSPAITATATSSSGSGGVLTLPVTITFTCTDAGSGVASCPAPIQVTTAGANQVFSGTATDKAGNTASTSIALSTENAPLAITASLSPAPINGWNNTNVSISYQCTGGVPPVQCPAARTVTAEGAGQAISATATDAAAQSATVTSTINIDKTPPTLTAATTPAPNAAGWNTSDVTITYTCSDNLSGVTACPPAQVVSTEGKAQQITASASDKAGNTTSTSTTINLEKTAPAITATGAPAPNAAGWNNSDVTVSFTCTPSVSDIVSCPSPVTVTAEGKGQEISGTVTDQAGKSNTATIAVSLDKTPPSIGITAPPAGIYTNNNHAPIAVSYSDSLSGIDVTTFHLSIDGVDHTAEFTATNTGASGSPAAGLPDGLHSITAAISDFAGNRSTATATFIVDTIPPQIVITQPPNGLFTNATSLVVSGTVTDASPVAVTVEGTAVPLQGNTFTSAGITLGTAATQLVHVVAVDAAGNATAVTLTINIDRTPPTITGTVNSPPNAAGWNNTSVTVSFTCSDADSGIATCPAPVPVTAEGANQAITGTATDKAGNSAQATVTVNIDETPPSIAATPAPAPNAAGWNTSDVTITYVCSDTLSGVVTCPAPQVVSTEGKGQQISATVSDKAGNTASAPVLLNIEKTSPAITATAAPPPNAAGWNNKDVTVNFVCTPSISAIVTCSPPVTVSTEGKGQNVSGTVSDQAGKTASTSVVVNLDKTPPLISSSAAPPPNAAGWNNTDVVVSYLCSDSLSGVSFCPPPATVSTEGSAEKISAQATDQAGNTSTVTTTLNIDKTPPVVTASAAPSPNGAGWNNTNVTVSYSCTDNLSGVASCPSQRLVTSEGQNQNISGQATDVAGNVGTGSISLSIDKTPPTIVQLSTPDHISRLHGGQVSVTVTDNFSVSQVVISVNGTTLGTFTAAPYQAALTVPAGANPGDTLTVTATATDEAGNTQSSSRGVRVAADGVIVGQVLSDATSFPIQGANVQSIGTSVSDQTDDHGRYSLQASDSHLFLTATSPSPATTTVEREVFVQEGVGTVPVDARLTPLAAPVAIGSAGGTLTGGNITVTVPSGAVGAGTSFQLTPLSGQGLPGLLPLGWSPLAAFDLRATSSAMNLSVAVAQLPNTVSHLVTYNPALHAWTMVAANLQAVNGTVNALLPSSGAYALAVADVVTPPITIPNPGQALTGINMQLLDPAASSSGSLSPAILPPSGGTAMATLGVQTTAAVPSGTVIQANISEKFSLKSGDVVSQENRSEDIVIYNALAPANSMVGAQFVVVPSRKFANAELLTGKVHLDILAGREGVRGQPGGSNPLTLTDGVSTLSVPGGALSEDTAISLQSISLEDFVPTTGSQSPIQEVLVDFSGDVLNTAAQLSISATGLNPADSFLLTKVQRIDGVPHMVLAALAHINGANLTSVATPGLPGVTQGGEYVFYDIPAPMGLVQGVVSSSAGPVQSLVQTDSLAIVSITGADGRYIVPALAGSANLKASAPHTNLIGGASVQVTAGQTTTATITLSGAVTSAVVSPADGTLGVPASTTITVTTTAPLNPQSIGQANLMLLKGTAASGTPVPLRPFVLSTSGTVLSFAPVNNLDPATQYTIQVSGLADSFGGAVVVPTSSFTTKAVAPLNFNPNAITFSFPDQNGNIHASAPAGSLPPGTKVLIIDQTNAIVLSLTALNDGSVSGNFLGTINDVLQITVTDPNGATANFTRSQFVAPDGSVAVGAGGGTVKGDGGVGLIIPEGALSQGVSFKLKLLDQTAFPQLPTWAGLNFGSGLHIDAPSMPSFNKEAKLAFPVPPNAPPNAFYYVYRRLTDQNGKTYFETIDHAFVQGTGASAQVVTASPPFCGYHNSYGNFNTVVSASAGAALLPQFTPFQDFILMWDIAQVDPNLPGVASPGLIVGKVFQAIAPQAGQTETTFQQYTGPAVTISLDTDPSKVAVYDGACATFTLFDPQLGGGTRRLTADNGSTQLHAVTTEVNGVQVDDATYLIYVGLENQYRNTGRVNFTFPPVTPPPPPPQIDIRIYTLNSQNRRIPARSILASGTPLVIAFKSQLTVTGATIGTTQLTVNKPDYLDNPQDDRTVPLDFRATDPSSGDQFHNYITAQPGPYTLTVTALSPLGGPAITVTKSFLVVGAGGTNTGVTASGPLVIDTTPVQNAKRVPQSTFPQIIFSEPVVGVPGNVMFQDNAGNFPTFTLAGIKTDGSVVQPVGPSDAITSLTLQPTSGLKFGTVYTLTLGAAILDQNQPPKNLTPYTLQFTTDGPQELDQNPDTTGFTRAVVIGDRAYVGTVLNAALSGLEVFDISNPTSPELKPGIKAFAGHVVDVAGLASSPVTRCSTEVLPGSPCPLQTSGGPLVAAAATVGATEFGLPSNIWLYDVSDPDHPARVGALSATSSATQDGSLLRIFMKDGFIFTSTLFKGLQVIDVQQAITEFQQTPPLQFGGAISTEGNGFALDAVMNTIPVPLPLPNGSGNVLTYQAFMTDVKAADYATAPPDPNNPSAPVPTQTLIVATGTVPFVVADPQQFGIQGIAYPPLDSKGITVTQPPFKDIKGSVLQVGRGVALGQIPVLNSQGVSVNQPIAVVVGSGSYVADDGSITSPAPLLAMVNMTDPRNPAPQRFVILLDSSKNPVYGSDVILKDNLALVGTSQHKILIVDISDPNHPVVAGEVDPRQAGGALGDRLALTDDGILITTSPNSAIGGLHTAILGSPCASFRATMKKSPPQVTPIDPNTPQLAWSMGGGFDQFSDSNVEMNQDGLVLTNVRLGRRQMAKEMSLPFFLLQRGQGSSLLRCRLFVANDDACTGVAPGVKARSRLFKYAAIPSNGQTFAYQAQFVIDHLDGDPDSNPGVPDSCVLLTQRYEFYKEGLKPFENFGKFPAAKFRPLVKYSYFTDANGPELNFLQTAQRLHLDPRSLTPDGKPVPGAEKSPVNDTMLSCDPELGSTACLVTPTAPGVLLSNPLNLIALGMFHNQNPLQTEQYVTIIQNGKSAVTPDPVPRIDATAFLQIVQDSVSLAKDVDSAIGTVDPLAWADAISSLISTIQDAVSIAIPLAASSTNTTILDNFHQNPTPIDQADQGIDDPKPWRFGCPACVHFHWRWSKNLTANPTVDPNQPIILTAAQAGISTFFVDPDFDGNNGKLILPPNPTQDVDIAILRTGADEEVHPSSTVFGLFQSQQPPSTILPSDLVNIHNANTGGPTTPVFWYVATGHKVSDTFFYHGGGFGTYYVNRITVPADNSPLDINVEHSRNVNYQMIAFRFYTDPRFGLIPLFSLDKPAGTLAQGIDDVQFGGFGPTGKFLFLNVSLDDTTLSPKHIWERWYLFGSPGVTEP